MSINANLIENLYNKAATRQSTLIDWSRTSVGVRQGCLLSPSFFNFFVEKIMTDTLITKEQSAVGGRTITNLRFANDIDGLAGKEAELASVVDRLYKTSAAFGIKVSTEKTKLMTSNTNGISFQSGSTVKNWTRLTAFQQGRMQEFF